MRKLFIINKLSKKYKKNKKVIIFMIKIVLLEGYNLEQAINLINEFYNKKQCNN